METKIYKALELLLYQNEQSQYQFHNYLSNIPLSNIEQLVDEFCTVFVKGGRRAGHTHALLDIILKHFNEDTVIFVTMENQRKLIKELLREKNIQNINMTIVGVSQLNLSRIKGKDVDAVFVDNISYLYKNYRDSIRKMVASFAIRKMQDKQPFYFVGVQ